MTRQGGNHFRRVGAARPSHLMFTGGVGALIDLPNFSVIVKGLESWDYRRGLTQQSYLVDEPRLRRAVNRTLGRWGASVVTELRSAPWSEGVDSGPASDAAQHIGVPVAPFPQWLRCTACNELAAADSDTFSFVNRNPSAPHEAKFVHDCKRGRNRPLAVAARFTLVCKNGHLDEFPYTEFVHRRGGCGHERPRLRMFDHGGNQAANVSIECVPCKERRNISAVLGPLGRLNLPACRGRHPHLDTFASEGCEEWPVLLVAGASNQWFPRTLSTLALPPAGADGVHKLVEERWAEVSGLTSRLAYDTVAALPGYGYLRDYDPDALIEAVTVRLGGTGDEAAAGPVAVDLLSPEWQALSSSPLPAPTMDFSLREAGVPESLRGLLRDVRQVERLREARALIGFTRLDAPDPEEPAPAIQVDLSAFPQEWVPASEVRGEGVFLRVDDELMNAWVTRNQHAEVLAEHREAYAEFRRRRRSDRQTGPFDPESSWPGSRYIALHTLSHLLIRTIALECGYNSASLSERIYAGTPEDPRTGILIYTAVPDSEGTLGGLVTLAEPADLERVVRRALRDARHCSSDPLCAERRPHKAYDYLHGAACHACLFVSETTCVRGNRFLDRRFLVPLDGDPELVLTPTELWP